MDKQIIGKIFVDGDKIIDCILILVYIVTINSVVRSRVGNHFIVAHHTICRCGKKTMGNQIDVYSSHLSGIKNEN